MGRGGCCGSGRHRSGIGVRRNGRLDEFQFRDSICYVLAITCDSELAIAVAFTPCEEVFSRAGGLDAEFFELRRGQGEEGLPGWDLCSVGGKAAADGCEEGGVVRDKGYGFGDWADGNLVVQRANAWPGCG